MGHLGGDVCASANPLMPVTPTVFPIQADNCHAGPNQRFDFLGSTIYTNSGQRCMSAGATNSFCDGSTNQQFYYSNGLIVSVETGQCLDVNVAQSNTLFSPTATSPILSSGRSNKMGQDLQGSVALLQDFSVSTPRDISSNVLESPGAAGFSI